jgi:acrylyl-CoA reductase (NADPH)
VRGARLLFRETYAGAVDSCGGLVLANILSLVKARGTVAACGLAAGMGLPTTVAPFILRGVSLAGIESVFMPVPVRKEAYARYGPLLTGDRLALVSSRMRCTAARCR